MPFCSRYTLGDAVAAYSPRAEAEAWRCPGAAAGKGATEAAAAAGAAGGSCRACLAEFVRRDVEARGKHREFEEMMAKYVPRGSLPGWTPRCKSEYRRWLCAELLAVSQSGCTAPRPCRLYCFSVLGACPFILPDSDDHLHGGLPGFLCPNFPGRGSPTSSTHEPLCCDWWPDSGPAPATPTQGQQQQQQQRRRGQAATGASEEEDVSSSSSSPTSSASSASSPTSSSSSSSSRARRPCCSSRLRLCALVLALLHAVVTVAALGHAPGPGAWPSAADAGAPTHGPGAPASPPHRRGPSPEDSEPL
uniref:Transmembrane protein FAM155A-like n=1 Tax=Petromyzon marinus TaxID=7757 RepID=A0AAJ7UGY5_PETMA|nr:transmembrane protein FAM155A-like [Petromyzon marinus]